MKLTKKKLALIALVVTLAIGNITFAILYVTRDVTITGGISTIGSIEVYQEDGTTLLTNIDFDNFTGGNPDTYITPDFFINNTGNQPVSVYWNISTSSIAWSTISDGYYYSEAATLKYQFYIRNGTADFWAPNTEARIIPVDQAITEEMLLSYSGSNKTAETISFTVTFYARDA